MLLCVQVDYNAKTEYDAVNNYKVLQAAFLKLGVDKVKAPAPQQRQKPDTKPI
jgi:hypothetical protein